LTAGYCIDVSGTTIAVDLSELTESGVGDAITLNDSLPIIHISGGTHNEKRYTIQQLKDFLLAYITTNSPISISSVAEPRHISLDYNAIATTTLNNADVFLTQSPTSPFIFNKITIGDLETHITPNITATAPISYDSGTKTMSLNTRNNQGIRLGQPSYADSLNRLFCVNLLEDVNVTTNPFFDITGDNVTGRYIATFTQPVSGIKFVTIEGTNTTYSGGAEGGYFIVYDATGTRMFATQSQERKVLIYQVHDDQQNGSPMFEAFTSTYNNAIKPYIKIYPSTSTLKDNSFVGFHTESDGSGGYTAVFRITDPTIEDGASHRNIFHVDSVARTIKAYGRNDTTNHSQLLITGGTGTGGGTTIFEGMEGSNILKIEEEGTLSIHEYTYNHEWIKYNTATQLLEYFDATGLIPIHTATTSLFKWYGNGGTNRQMRNILSNVNKLQDISINNNRVMVETDCANDLTSFKEVSSGNGDTFVEIDHQNHMFKFKVNDGSGGFVDVFAFDASLKLLSVQDNQGAGFFAFDFTKSMGQIGLMNIDPTAIQTGNANALSGDVYKVSDGAGDWSLKIKG
jgi:hypothetical protein